MLEKIKSISFIEVMFSYVSFMKSLKIIKYNLSLQKKKYKY